MRTNKLQISDSEYIEYKLPNIPQALRLLDKLDLQALAEMEKTGNMNMGKLADLLDCIEPYIVKVEMKAAKSYEDLSYLPDFIEHVMSVFTEINKVLVSGDKDTKN